MPDGQRAALPRNDDFIFIAVNNQRNGISAIKRGKCVGCGLPHITATVQVLGKQMGDDFRIRIGRKTDAIGDKLFFQLFIILDNAIMHHRNALTAMRMRIGFNGGPMCCPACMPDADAALQRTLAQFFAQSVELTLGAATHQLAVGNGCNSRTVITAIFQSLKPVKNRLGDIVFADNANNTTHN